MMIDIQNHLRNEGLLNLFDGRSVVPSEKRSLGIAHLNGRTYEVIAEGGCEARLISVEGVNHLGEKVVEVYSGNLDVSQTIVVGILDARED